MTTNNEDQDDDGDGVINLAKDAVENAQNNAEQLKQQARSTIDWIPDAKMCEECDTQCDPDVDFVKRQAQYMKIWSCPECDARYYREEPWDTDSRVNRFD